MSNDKVNGDKVGSDQVGSDQAGEAVPARPLLRIVRGEPDDAELVALTAVVLGIASAGGSGPAAPQRSAWSDHAVLARRTLPHGPGAWRASGFPR